TTISGAGAEIQEPPCIHTSGFTYGPLDKTGACRVTISYDHRLMDGHHVAKMLGEFEERLQTEILEEVRQPGQLLRLEKAS
ncbi:MAG: 2-oxo acid dehydrogenase subunit E2, partial [Pirellulaceae bacterium]